LRGPGRRHGRAEWRLAYGTTGGKRSSRAGRRFGLDRALRRRHIWGWRCRQGLPWSGNILTWPRHGWNRTRRNGGRAIHDPTERHAALRRWTRCQRWTQRKRRPAFLGHRCSDFSSCVFCFGRSRLYRGHRRALPRNRGNLLSGRWWLGTNINHRSVQSFDVFRYSGLFHVRFRRRYGSAHARPVPVSKSYIRADVMA
jgi:hypothetical protein